MIVGIFHEGSGLGNQLARYVFTRVKAKDLGVPFGMIGHFKGKDFMELDLGENTEGVSLKTFKEERVDNPQGVDIRPYDTTTELITDDTMVDGEFQDERYFEHRIDEVREWLRVVAIRMWDNVCVINFRGGEYVGVSELFLTQDYWDLAIAEMRKINHDMKFEVHTDDEVTARKFFPDFVIKTGMEINWRSIRYAHYLILSNSSFAILPALLNEEAKHIIAPLYWARRNVSNGYWAMEQNKYKKFTYV
jgi:hypothetical protein